MAVARLATHRLLPPAVPTAHRRHPPLRRRPATSDRLQFPLLKEAARRLLTLAPRLHGASQGVQDVLRVVPAHAGIGDALAVLEFVH